MIKVVCLDLDGVFFERAHDNLIKNLAKKFDLEERSLEELLFVQAAKEGGYDKLKCGQISSSEYWTWLFQKLNLSKKVTKDDFLEISLQGYRINPKAVKLIDRLHRQGIKTAICSNNYKDNIESLDNKFNFKKYFDILVFSYEVRVMKPNRQILDELIRRAQVSPSEIFFSDDKNENIEAAKNLGLKAFLYTSFTELIAQLKRCGIFSVKIGRSYGLSSPGGS